MPKIKETLEDLEAIEKTFFELQKETSYALEKLREFSRRRIRYGRLPYAHQIKRARGTIIGIVKAIMEEQLPPAEELAELRKRVTDLIGINFGDPDMKERVFARIDECSYKQLTALLADVESHVAFRDEGEELSFDDLAVNGELHELITHIKSGDVVINASAMVSVSTMVGNVEITPNNPKKNKSFAEKQRRNDLENYGFPTRSGPLDVPDGWTCQDRWPLRERPELRKHELAKRIAPEGRYHPKAFWSRYISHVKDHKPKWFSNRLAHFPKSDTAFSAIPLIVDELQDLNRETHKALHDGLRRDETPSESLVCIPDLIYWDDSPPRTLLSYKRMGQSRVLEVQIALGQLGFYRHGKDWFMPTRPDRSDLVKPLNGSIAKSLFRRFRRMEFLPNVLANHYETSLDETILPDYEVPVCVAKHPKWLRLFPDIHKPGVGGAMTKQFRGAFHEQVPEMETLIHCPFGEFVMGTRDLAEKFQVGEYPLKRYFPGVSHLFEENLWGNEPQVGCFNILAAFATMKALFGRHKETGYSWYETEYGHKMWWHKKIDADFLPLAEQVRNEIP